jgi:hypothetical protein
MNAARTGILIASTTLALLAGCSARRPTVTGPDAIRPEPTRSPVSVVLLEDLGGRQIFPPSDAWNLDASQAPVDSNSQAYIAWIKQSAADHAIPVCRPQAYFGRPPFGIPYVVVSGAQPLQPLTFLYGQGIYEAGAPGRPAGYPIPEEAKSQPGYIEGGVPGGGTYGDRHMIVLDRDHGLLFETWATRWDSTAAHWEVGGAVTFDLSVGGARPEGASSANAAGLALLPGLVRYDEAHGPGAIRHAFLCNLWATNGHVWPASHTAYSMAGAPPMGTRLRLKASVDLSGYPTWIRQIFQAMKTYGLIVTDNGGCEFGITGTMDPRWDSPTIYQAFGTLSADDFEVVQLGWGRPAP